MAHWKDPFARPDLFREEFMRRHRQRVIDAGRAKPQPKAKRAKRAPGARKAWAIEQLRKLIERGDPKPQQTLLKLWPKKYGPIKGRDARQRLQRNLLRWKGDVEAEIAAERKSVI
jgi:hypothetical protein